MPGVVRRSDVCSGHCFSPRASSSWSKDVFANKIHVVRYSDTRPVHRCGSSCHSGSNVGVHDVYSNSKYIQTIGDDVSCGSTQAQGSPDVIVN